MVGLQTRPAPMMARLVAVVGSPDPPGVAHRRSGGLDLTGKAAVLKTAGPHGPWGFESLVLR